MVAALDNMQGNVVEKNAGTARHGAMPADKPSLAPFSFFSLFSELAEFHLMRTIPFNLSIPQSDLDGLKHRLASTRWAEDFGNQTWAYGVERGWLEDMVAYWRDSFDWRVQEVEINRYPHYRVEIDGIPIHFMHVKGRGPNPRPLILSHGWPWTFWDFRELIEPLTNPAAHGGKPEESFDLVVPSLPGFGFSGPLRTTGIQPLRIAELWVRLMRDGLGYSRFGACGGDWGGVITTLLGHAYPEHLTGIYSTKVNVPGIDVSTVPPSDFSNDEQWMVARNAESLPLVISHSTVHGHDPQTLAYALNDSPVGTAAWIWERRRAWSDCNGDVLAVHDRDFLCTLASIYWLTGTIGTSMRIYFEHFKTGRAPPKVHDRRLVIEVPTGFGIFPKDVSHLPRSLVATHTNLQRWTVASSGGHFGPSERPQFVVNELREFFSTIN